MGNYFFDEKMCLVRIFWNIWCIHICLHLLTYIFMKIGSTNNIISNSTRLDFISSSWACQLVLKRQAKRSHWLTSSSDTSPQSFSIVTHFYPPLRFRNQFLRKRLKPLIDDSALRALSSLRGLRGHPRFPHYAERRSLSDSKCWTQRWAKMG